MADQLVSLLVTFCIPSAMVSYSYGLLPSLSASTLNTTLEDHHFNVSTLSDVLELTTSNASWTTSAIDIAFNFDSIAPNLATTAEDSTSHESSASAATANTFSVDSTVPFSVTTGEQTTSDTFWTTAATDITFSVDSTVPFSVTTGEQTTSDKFWSTATEDTTSSAQSLELTTSDPLWTTAATDIAFTIVSTVPISASTAEMTTSDASWTTVATDITLSASISVPFSVSTAEQTMSHTFWTISTKDITSSDQVTGTWSAWSMCSRSCDGGLQRRIRVSEMTTNAGVQEEIESDNGSSRPCNTNFCQVNFTEESYGVYIDLRTTLNTAQYVQVRDHIRAGIGWEIVRFCNSSNNFATCCAGQTLRAPLAQRQSLLDSIVVKRAATQQNDSAVVRLFLVVMADAALAICQRPGTSATTIIAHSAARRSAKEEQIYMSSTVLSRLLEIGSLAQTINRTFQDHLPNVTVEIVAWRIGVTTTPLPEASSVTPSMVKPCGALMELSQEHEQCIYSITFYVAIISPSIALVLVVVATLLAYKRRRRGVPPTKRCRGDSSSGSPGCTENISRNLTNPICRSSGNINDICENASTFQSGCQARESAAAAANNDAPQPRPLPPLPPLPSLPGYSAEDADGYMKPCHGPTNSEDPQKTIGLPPAWQLPMRESAAVVSGPPAARSLGERLTQHEYQYVETEADTQRRAAGMPASALPECGEYDYAVRMPEIDSEYASTEDDWQTARNSVSADDSAYVCMG